MTFLGERHIIITIEAYNKNEANVNLESVRDCYEKRQRSEEKQRIQGILGQYVALHQRAQSKADLLRRLRTHRGGLRGHSASDH